MKLQGKEIKNALNNSFTFTVLVEQSRKAQFALKSARKTAIWEIISSIASKAKIKSFWKFFFSNGKQSLMSKTRYLSQIHIIIVLFVIFPSFLEHIYYLSM